MMRQKIVTYILILSSCITLLQSCANRGSGPQGGFKDVMPPRLLKGSPANNSYQVNKQRIVLTFDENVALEKPEKNVIISPPQIQPAIVKAIAHKIIVELQDSLLENTTYTIDFTSAIQDNNEKNKLENFVYTFSTADLIDTMQISGHVIDAATLNPIKGMLVGIHQNTQDTAFTNMAFERITRTDAEGHFTIHNITPGAYKVYALEDIGNNFMYDVPTEALAFSDSIYTTRLEMQAFSDTVWVAKTNEDEVEVDFSQGDTIPDDALLDLKVDTILSGERAVYYPQNILLRSFVNPKERQYLKDKLRKKEDKMTFIFNTKNDSLPLFTGLNIDLEKQAFIQCSKNNDTIHFWLTDSLAWQQDTLKVVAQYQKTDTANILRWQNDTIIMRFFHKKKQKEKRGLFNRHKKKEKKRTPHLSVKMNTSLKFDVYKPLEFKFQKPTFLSDSAKAIIQLKVDTLWKDLPTTLVAADSLGFKYTIAHKWQADSTYRILVDSASFYNYYGICNNTIKKQFKIKTLEEYASLKLKIQPHTGFEYVEMLNKDDKIVRRLPIDSLGSVHFLYMDPGTYYVRLFIDTNHNKKWDTGDFQTHTQPEMVYYFPYTVNLRAFWDMEESWNYLKVNILEQKPLELIKD